MLSSPFFRGSEARTKKFICDDSGFKLQAALFHTLHYRTAQGIAVDIFKWNDRFKSPWRQKKSLANDIFAENL